MNEEIKKRIVGLTTLTVITVGLLALVIKMSHVVHKRENPTHRVIVAQIPDRPVRPEVTPIPTTEVHPLASSDAVPAKPTIVLPPLVHMTQSKPTPAVTIQPPHINHAWVVQLGSFKNKAHAQKLLSKLKGHGFSPYIKKTKRAWQVVIGPEFKKSDAQQLIRQINKQFKIKGIIKKPLKIKM